jgi:hypothetical protein
MWASSGLLKNERCAVRNFDDDEGMPADLYIVAAEAVGSGGAQDSDEIYCQRTSYMKRRMEAGLHESSSVK